MPVPFSVAAILATIGFLVLAGFQGALAAGVPWGRAAWGGKFERLPQNLRVASAVSMVVWLVAALVVLDRAGIPLIDLPDIATLWGTWVLVVLLVLGAIVNFASSSRFERFGWAPMALVTAVLTLVVALS
jgi:hypothetical protein